MLNAFGDNKHFPFADIDSLPFELDAQMAIENKKKLIFVSMTVPSQRASDFGYLDVGIVDFPYDSG